MSFNRGQKKESNYVYSSSLKMNLHYGKDNKQAIKAGELLDAFSTGNQVADSTEINITLTAEKAADFINKLQAAQEDQQGDGGVRLTLYMSEKHNDKTGETFDSMSILTMAKFPAENKFQKRGGSFSGNRGGGRRDYGGKSNSHSTADSSPNQERTNGRPARPARKAAPVDQEETNTDAPF